MVEYLKAKWFRLPHPFLLFLEFFAIPFFAAALAWSGRSILLLPMALILPMTLSIVHTKRMAFAGALSYFAGALWPIIPGSTCFFKQPTIINGAILWLLWAALLAAPFSLVGRVRPAARAFVVLLIIVIEAISPIGVASPILAAGVLFPTMGVFGILGIASLIIGLSERMMWMRGIAVITVLLLFTLFFSPPIKSLAGWTAYDTHFQPTADYFWGQYSRTVTMVEDHNRGKSIVSVFPENTLPGWTDPVSDMMVRATMSAYVPGTHSFIFGAERIESRDRRVPVVLARGHNHAEYVVRVPVPIAEWGRDVPLDFFGPSTITVDGVRAGVLICYEQLLVYPVLRSVYDGATVLVAPSNLYWAKGSTISNAQEVCVRSWSRLFNIPYYRAVNR